MAEVVLNRLRRKFGDAILETNAEHGNETAVVAKDRLVEIATFLRDDPELELDMPIDCTGVDWYERREPRFDVIYHLYSVARRHRLRLKVQVTLEDPTCPSLVPVWPGMNWHERECWDMYGIRFVGHPNLTRVLLYEEFEGHPLRKDYPIDRRQPLVELREVAAEPTQRHAPIEKLNRP